MFVTHKNSKVTGYTKVYKYGETIGGGWYETPEGGGFHGGPCGEPCLWDGGKSPEDKRATNVEMYTISNGFCASSRKDSCSRQGYCSVQAQTETGVKEFKDPYATYTSSAKLFAKQTCLEGLTSTQTKSENPYTKTAEQACVTSINSGKDVPFAGAFPSTTLDCFYVTLSGALSLYANGPNFPAVLDTDKTTTYCAQIHENGECIDPRDCTGVAVMPTYYDGCGKPDARFGACLPIYKTVGDPCPIYFEPDCESAYILSKTGNYITTGSKNIGSFSTASVYALSTDKAVEFSMSSGSSSPKIEQTFTYGNDEVKLNGLKGKESTYTNSYIWIGESGASTSTYKVGAGGYEAGDPVTLFYSGEVKATSEGALLKTTGPGSNPCCDGSQCTSEEVSKATTDTVFAGSSFLFTHSKISTIQLGDYVAYQATSITRKDHLAWGEFAYSTSAGDSYKSHTNRIDKYECVSFSSPILPYTGPRGWYYEGGYICEKCVAGVVQRPVNKSGPPDTAQCPGLDCGCTGKSGGKTTVPGPDTVGVTNCPDSCISMAECRQQYVLPDGSPYEGCCEQDVVVGDPVWNTDRNQINRDGDCAIVNKMSLDVAYTHLTRAQTLTTRIGFEDGGFQATLQKSEGLYFLDSKGSMQTATSYSLKQSKSDITDSQVTFAFAGAYYNPMGKTTQFGSDGAKKTFIALATGDAVYLVGSPDGKSKGTATASHDGDVHSYYISDPTAKIWNQASWPGHGVVNGKITTGTFSYSFNTGAFKNSYGTAGSIARFLPGWKQTIVAHGGLNVISSKDNVSEKSFKTTYSTKAFSTSFDSSYEGAWIAKAVPYTYVATKSVGYDPNHFLGIETNHVFSINCPGCDFPQPAIPYPLIGDTAAYFIKGAKSLIYNDNADTYLWTHPAFKKLWGAGHGAECEE